MLQDMLKNFLKKHFYNYKESTADVVSHLYSGTSTVTLSEQRDSKDHQLVGANGFNNLFFVRDGVAEDELREIGFTSTLRHPWATQKFLDSAAIDKLKFK